jgi:small subunit ribosomal protein S1
LPSGAAEPTESATSAARNDSQQADRAEVRAAQSAPPSAPQDAAGQAGEDELGAGDRVRERPAASRAALVPRQIDLDDDELSAALGDVQLDQLLGGGKVTSLELDSRYRATVVKIDHDSVFLALGSQNDGVASLRQFAAPPAVGETLEVIVSRYLPEDGLYEVVVPGATVAVSDWSDVDEGVTVEARVTGHNTGGLECEVNGMRAFIPASQASLYRVEDLSELVGQKLTCVVTQANPQRRNLVLSHRAYLEREQEASRKRLLGELAVGQIREGVVRNIRDFGAFVDLGGLDGLIHVTQLSWDRIKHPSDVVQVGQRVKVRVEKIDPATQKISLSYRDLLSSPWENIEAEFPVGAVVAGTVTKVMEFGAFVRLAAGIEGLVHISELAHRRVQRVSQIVREGDAVQVKILAVDRENQKLSLSLKQAQAAAPTADASEEADEESLAASASRSAGRGPSEPLKGGTDRRSGGDRFGLNW